MKRLLFFLFIPAVLSAQPVVTETARNLFKNHTGTASVDSVSTTSSRVKFLVGVIINASVASDSIILKQGTETIATIILGSTIVGAPTSAFYNVKIDSPFVTVERKKTSNVTTIWRSKP